MRTRLLRAGVKAAKAAGRPQASMQGRGLELRAGWQREPSWSSRVSPTCENDVTAEDPVTADMAHGTMTKTADASHRTTTL